MTKIQAQKNGYPNACTHPHYPERGFQGDIKREANHTPLTRQKHELRAEAHNRRRADGGMSGRGSCIKLWVDCGRRKQWGAGEGWRDGGRDSEKKIGPIKKYYIAYGKNNTGPGVNKFWILVRGLPYCTKVGFRKHVFVCALYKTQRFIMTCINLFTHLYIINE